MVSKLIKSRFFKALVLMGLSLGFIGVGGAALWVATLKIPDLNTIHDRKVSQSTKIYDRTGEVILYDLNVNVRRTNVDIKEISPYIQNATIAIEDDTFYKHSGIRPASIVRAILADIMTGSRAQGGSTITQQVVKMALLTKDKTASRKIKEWILAIKLEKVMPKEEILETYLNEAPYGGTLYGVEEASQAFFGKPASEVTLPEAAYIAAIPQLPTYYSPYGTHREDLDARQKTILRKMLELKMITKEEYASSTAVKVQFLSKNNAGIRAPHFVMMVRDYLAQKYGEQVVNEGGLKVVTTLDYKLQQKGEEVVTSFAPTLQENFNASNASIVAIDPKTGDILTLVGSKDYFNEEIDGNYNIALARRQPGSTFKPFVYATAFKKGYTPSTMLFDVKTEFSTRCNPDGTPKNPADDPVKTCYSPVEYDNTFPGPMSMKEALAQSRNVPAVKALYLAGLNDSIETARDMGILSLTDPNRYGLTLVLGGGEVPLLELTSAYGVFANDGVRNPYRMVLEITDSDGVTLEKAELTPATVLEPEVSRQITDILSDNKVRLDSLKPIANSVGRQVAIKTGTTNDYRDVWTVGYTPNIVVGAWAGNNDNSPMQRNVAGLIISPLWGAFMSQAAKEFPPEDFKEAPPAVTDNKPVLHGVWQGGISYWKDTVSGKVATEYTPLETRQEVIFPSVHTILHWLNKSDPNGPIPTNPSQDPQYEYWEYGVRKWFDEWIKSNPNFKEVTEVKIPTEVDDVHTANSAPKISITSPQVNASVDSHALMTVRLSNSGTHPIQKIEVYLNGKYVMTSINDRPEFSFVPADVSTLTGSGNVLNLIVYDTAQNRTQVSTTFNVND